MGYGYVISMKLTNTTITITYEQLGGFSFGGAEASDKKAPAPAGGKFSYMLYRFIL